jgi:hypothetical protein
MTDNDLFIFLVGLFIIFISIFIIVYYSHKSKSEKYQITPTSGAFVLRSSPINFSFTGLASGVNPNTLVITSGLKPLSTPYVLNLPDGLNLWTALYKTASLGVVPIVTNTIIITNQSTNAVIFRPVSGSGNITTSDGKEYVLNPKSSVEVWAKFTQKGKSSATCEISFGKVVTFNI